MADPDVRRANTAAQHPTKKPPEGSADEKDTGSLSQPSNQIGHNGVGGHGAACRAFVAVLAAVVIAFCAWSMGEYVNGRDPLSFLRGSVEDSRDASTSADGASGDDSSSSASADVSAKRAQKTSELSSDDVANLLADGLTFGGDDVSVSKDDFLVVLNESGVWVEQVDRDGAQALVDKTARRTAALASWLEQRNARGEVSVASVTWITEDANGIVRMVVEDVPGKAATSGDTKELLSSARAYLISADTYAKLGSVGYPATQGETPKLPDGTPLQVDAVVRKEGEGEVSGSKAESTKLVRVSTTTGAEGGGGGSASTSGSVSGSGSSGGQPSRSGFISVRVSVAGSGTTVSLPAGSTAYDALLATGASVEAGANPYGSGTWVYAINGRGQDASHGWTYSVNGRLPGVMSDLYPLHDGDSVSWNYVAG